MAKKRKRHKIHHATHHISHIEHISGTNVENLLIENFTNLQKVLTNLSVKFDSLAEQISKLLQLFEISARSFAERTGGKGEVERDKEFLDKLNSLLEQNKLIARGLTLMEEKMKERLYGSMPQTTSSRQKTSSGFTESLSKPRKLPTT